MIPSRAPMTKAHEPGAGSPGPSTHPAGAEALSVTLLTHTSHDTHTRLSSPQHRILRDSYADRTNDEPNKRDFVPRRERRTHVTARTPTPTHAEKPAV